MMLWSGYLLSVIIAACEEAVKDTPLRDAIHLTAYFLKSCEVGDCEVHVKFLRSGKAFYNMEALLVQKVCMIGPLSVDSSPI